MRCAPFMKESSLHLPNHLNLMFLLMFLELMVMGN